MYKTFGKRMLDILLSLLGLVLLSPVLLVLTVSGAAALGGNPFFCQLRPGRREQLFCLIKFRSMTEKRNVNGELLPDALRLTTYGRFLRKTSLDELPELWNVLTGDMSLVGPRPQLVRDMVFMTPQQRCRHSVRPGITGLAQVSGRNGISWEEKLAWDLKYLEHISLGEDLRILVKTVGQVLRREGISAEGMDTAEDLGDWLLRTGKLEQEAYERKQFLAKEILRKGWHK